jgi:hypothetical protein
MFESYTYYGNNLFLNDINISGPVGVNDNAKAESTIRVSPNPSEGVFTVSMTNCPGSINLSISDVTGKPVYSEDFSTSGETFSRRFDFSNLNAGMYFLRVTSKTGTQAAKFVIR